MRVRMGTKLGAAARQALAWLVHRMEDVAVAILRMAGRRRRPPARSPRPARADERTVRHLAEEERGGLSSAESAARWVSGDNPGGLHHKAVHHEGPEHQRPSQDEPQDPKERVPRGEYHMATNRRG